MSGLDPWHDPCKYSGQPLLIVLETIAIILLLLWLLGLVSSYTMGGFIHVLLVAGVVAILIRVARGDRPLA